MDPQVLMWVWIVAGVIVGIPAAIGLGILYTRLWIAFIAIRTKRAQAEALLTLELAQAARAKADQMRHLVQAEGELHELNIERKRSAAEAEARLRETLRNVKAGRDTLQQLADATAETAQLKGKNLVLEAQLREARTPRS